MVAKEDEDGPRRQPRRQRERGPPVKGPLRTIPGGPGHLRLDGEVDRDVEECPCCLNS